MVIPIALNLGDRKMPSFKDTSVEVAAVTNDTITLQIGPEGHIIDKGVLASAISGGSDPIATLVQNIGIRLALSGVSVEDDVGIKREIERVTFKMCR
jgi:hypothetical protein